nr:hypothetical protein [Alphaproteobacteria bacterium]
MRVMLMVALCAVTLSGCMANRPSHRTGPRWTGGGADAPFYQGGVNTPAVNAEAHS